MSFFARNRTFLIGFIAVLVILVVSLLNTRQMLSDTPHMMFNKTVPVIFISEAKYVENIYSRVVKIEWNPEDHSGELEKFFFPADDYQEINSERVDGPCLLTMYEIDGNPHIVVDLPQTGRANCPDTE